MTHTLILQKLDDDFGAGDLHVQVSFSFVIESRPFQNPERMRQLHSEEVPERGGENFTRALTKIQEVLILPTCFGRHKAYA
ncbi:MAG: hypothetical protein ACO376_00890 [Gammaproteobacteria bacterium]